MTNAIFIGATGENVGKTTLCLGILAALKKRFKRVGFVKPIGQHHLTVENSTIVDKDAVLFKQHFNLKTAWTDMSPVIIPSGFTRDYLDNKITESELLQKIKKAFNQVVSQNDYTIVEGTGHIGVGSIIDLNNARVAAELGVEIVMIAPGGLGSSFDELALNIAMCQKYGVSIRGVILNRVIESKRDMVSHYIEKALQRWEIPLIGCVPYNELLSTPTFGDYVLLFNTAPLAGIEFQTRHFEDIRLVAVSFETYQREIISNELVITPACREDIIQLVLQKNNGGLILTGRHTPSETILKAISASQVPTLYTSLPSYEAMKMITSFIAKIRAQDQLKIERAIELVEKYIDVNAMCGLAVNK